MYLDNAEKQIIVFILKINFTDPQVHIDQRSKLYKTM